MQAAQSRSARCKGYVFAAKTQAAKLARRMGEHDLEKKLPAEAQILREKFDAAFWCADLGTFALALDGSGHGAAI
jgi:glycogen debranching enzyme